jgi:hypothetical protein
MTKSSDKLRARIERGEQRSAQLKAQLLIRDRRDAQRARDAQQRRDTRKKIALGAMLMDAGITQMPAAEILGALMSYRDLVVDPANRERYTSRGTVWLSSQKAPYIASLD